MTNRPWNGRGHVTWSTSDFKALNPISGIREVSIVQFLTQLGCIKCNQKHNISPHINGHDYGHVTVFRFSRLPWCSASRGFFQQQLILVINIVGLLQVAEWRLWGSRYSEGDSLLTEKRLQLENGSFWSAVNLSVCDYVLLQWSLV